MSLYRALTRKQPIQMQPNATLYYDRDLGTYTLNPITGNEEPDTQTVEVRAVLTNDKRSPIADMDSIKAEVLHLTGYLLTDQAGIDGLDMSQTCKIALTQPQGGTVEGDFSFQVRATPFSQEVFETMGGIRVDGTLVLAGSGEV